MDSIVAIQAISGALYLLTISVVGFRLLLLARRSRGLPELLLGAALVLGGTVGGPLEAAALAKQQGITGDVAGRLLLAGKLFGLGSLTCQSIFVWRVFRPDSGWAAVLVGVLVCFPLAGMAGYAMNGTFVTAEIPMLWFWIDLGGRCGASLWMLIEGSLYYRLMTRRLRLGLADPVVTNRFLLWSIAGGISLVLLLSAVPPMVLDPVSDTTLLSVDLIVFSAAGVAVSMLYFLTFLPPESYRQRLLRAAAVAR